MIRAKQQKLHQQALNYRVTFHNGAKHKGTWEKLVVLDTKVAWTPEAGLGATAQVKGKPQLTLTKGSQVEPLDLISSKYKPVIRQLSSGAPLFRIRPF